jgi:hypothetical protein
VNNSWISVKNACPELYNALGIELSEYILVCDIKESTVTIASLWVMDDKHVWRDLNGITIKPTHWQYIKLPKGTNDN